LRHADDKNITGSNISFDKRLKLRYCRSMQTDKTPPLPIGLDDLPLRGFVSTAEIAARLGYAHPASLLRFCREHSAHLPQPVRKGYYRTADIRDWFDRLGEAPGPELDDMATLAACANDQAIINLDAIRQRMNRAEG
jgi:hypothetical protein